MDARSLVAECADPDLDPSVTTTPPALLTVAEVAAMFRVSKMTIYRMIQTGQITAVRMGKSFRIPSTLVDAFLLASAVGPPGSPPT